jgi:hypothetical protein
MFIRGPNPISTKCESVIDTRLYGNILGLTTPFVLTTTLTTSSTQSQTNI